MNRPNGQLSHEELNRRIRDLVKEMSRLAVNVKEITELYQKNMDTLNELKREQADRANRSTKGRA